MKSYKTELDLNNKQKTACLKHAGAARFVWNWGLRKRIDAYETEKKTLNSIDLHKELNKLKKTEFPWLYETSKCAPQGALQNLDKAYENFFRRCREKVEDKGFPKFKSKKKRIGSFTLTGAIHVFERTVQLPRLGVFKLKERGYFPVSVPIVSVTVSEKAGRWFVSIQTKEKPKRTIGTEILGMDVGIKSLAVLDDGTVFENPKALYKAEKKLIHLQRNLDRKKKGSQNRKKAKLLFSRLSYRVSCIRKDSTHKVSDAIAKRAKVIGMESLNVQGMMQNHCLAKAVADASMSELHRQIEYKMKWSGGIIVKADQWFPSSKTCSACGSVNHDLVLSDREWVCKNCGVIHDRDVNAAINLRNLAVSSTVGSHACGGIGSQVQPMKQESNTIQGIVLNG